MRESGGNPEQYPLPYAREAAARGVSRSLGETLRRRSGRRGTGLSHTVRAGRPMAFIQACVSMSKILRGKVGRGGSVTVCRGFCLGCGADKNTHLRDNEGMSYEENKKQNT